MQNSTMDELMKKDVINLEDLKELNKKYETSFLKYIETDDIVKIRHEILIGIYKVKFIRDTFETMTIESHPKVYPFIKKMLEELDSMDSGAVLPDVSGPVEGEFKSWNNGEEPISGQQCESIISDKSLIEEPSALIVGQVEYIPSSPIDIIKE